VYYVPFFFFVNVFIKIWEKNDGKKIVWETYVQQHQHTYRTKGGEKLRRLFLLPHLVEGIPP